MLHTSYFFGVTELDLEALHHFLLMSGLQILPFVILNPSLVFIVWPSPIFD